MPMIPDKYRGTTIYSIVYCRLLHAANRKEAVGYYEIGDMMRLESGDDMYQEIGQLLGEINEDEHNRGRPMLSAVAVDTATRMPGEAFFSFARRLGKLPGDTEQDKREFWHKEIQEVYETW